MNCGVIVKANAPVDVVWLGVSRPDRKSDFWMSRTVNPDEAALLKGLGLKVGSVGDALIADLGEDMEAFHKPVFAVVSSKHLYLMDCRNADDKRNTASFFFADHMIKLEKASVHDDRLDLLLGDFVVQGISAVEGRAQRTRTLFNCYGKLPLIPEDWTSLRDYSEGLKILEMRSSIKPFSELLLDEGTCKTLNPMHAALIKKYIEITN